MSHFRSRCFQEQIPYKAHLVRFRGVAGEVTDLRHDIDTCLFAYEQDGQLAPYYTATVDPTVTDDETLGFTLFSRWINTTVPQKEFVLLKTTAGGAIWKETTNTTGGSVLSVFTRTGNVTAVAGDYDASQITNDSGVTGLTVKDALDQLNFDKVGTAGVINDTEHGNLSGGFLHALATTLASGFMSFGDKTKLDGIDPGATNTPLSSTAPVDVTKSAAVIGVGTTVARADHKHDILTATAVTITSLTNAEGVLTSLARSDHSHAHGDLIGGTLHAEATPVSSGFMSYGDKDKLDSIETGAEVNDVFSVFSRVGAVVAVAGDYDASQVDNDSTVPGAFVDDALDYLYTNTVPITRTLTAGAGLTGGGDLSANRTFDVVANADGSIIVNANDVQVGILATDAQHGIRGGGTQHALVSVGSAGFMSATDKSKLDGIASGATVDAFTAKVSSNDTTPGFLNGKLVAGTGVTLTENFDGANETLTIAAPGSTTDEKVKVTSNDTTADYLFSKVIAGTGITLTEINDGLDEDLRIAIDFTSAVPSTRTLTAGAGLTGGGDLSADRTFNVIAAAGGSITVNADSIERAALTGDVTAPADSNVTTIAASAVTLAKMANVATSTVFYRKTAGTGAPEVQTLATLKTDLGLTGTNSGDQTITLTGDVTGSGTGSFAATIANDAVTDAKLRNSAGFSVIGKTATGTGDPADIVAADETVLGRTGAGNLVFAQVATGQVANDAITNTKLANMATQTIKGRTTAGTGDPEDLTAAQVQAILGLTPASTTEVLTGTATDRAVTPDSLAALWEKGSNVASAATVSLGEGGFFHITGTTTITDIDFATPKDGRLVYVQFDGVLTLTHNATTLQLPGNANIVTAAGDRACFVQDASDNVVCLWYQRAATLYAALTKELFVVPPSQSGATIGDHPTVLVAANGTGYVEFRVPADFTSLTSAEVMAVPVNTAAAANIDLNSDYGAAGEAYNANSETNTTITFAFTASQIKAMDVSSVLAGIAAGDQVGVSLLHNGVTGGVHYLGVRIKYT